MNIPRYYHAPPPQSTVAYGPPIMHPIQGPAGHILQQHIPGPVNPAPAHHIPPAPGYNQPIAPMDAGLAMDYPYRHHVSGRAAEVAAELAQYGLRRPGQHGLEFTNGPAMHPADYGYGQPTFPNDVAGNMAPGAFNGYSNCPYNREMAGVDETASEERAEAREENAEAETQSARSRVAGKFKQAAGAILRNRRKEAKGVAEQEQGREEKNAEQTARFDEKAAASQPGGYYGQGNYLPPTNGFIPYR